MTNKEKKKKFSASWNSKTVWVYHPNTRPTSSDALWSSSVQLCAGWVIYRPEQTTYRQNKCTKYVQLQNLKKIC